jgi:hypothetical protein
MRISLRPPFGLASSVSRFSSQAAAGWPPVECPVVPVNNLAIALYDDLR